MGLLRQMHLACQKCIIFLSGEDGCVVIENYIALLLQRCAIEWIKFTTKLSYLLAGQFPNRLHYINLSAALRDLSVDV